jgi:hypothetical protein
MLAHLGNAESASVSGFVALQLDVNMSLNPGDRFVDIVNEGAGCAMRLLMDFLKHADVDALYRGAPPQVSRRGSGRLLAC